MFIHGGGNAPDQHSHLSPIWTEHYLFESNKALYLSLLSDASFDTPLHHLAQLTHCRK
jgi:hypothetical protein